MLKFIKISLICIVIPIFLTSCGGFNRTDTVKNQPINAKDRVKKNIEEGRGLRLGTSMTMGPAGNGSFLFASSNALWRATLEKLDFIPLSNVDYAGGVIITDWYGDTQSFGKYSNQELIKKTSRLGLHIAKFIDIQVNLKC